MSHGCFSRLYWAAMIAMSAGVPAMMARACSVTRSAGQSHQAARRSLSMSASS
ncbi:hypothetical protein [Actinocorallia lasiicapitis]